MLNDCLRAGFDDEDRGALILPSFWESTEPCEWNAVNYLIELYDKNPLLSRRTAHKYLIQDALYLKRVVCSNTVAEEMLISMCKFKKGKTRSAALNMFYAECVDDIRKSSLRKRAAKASMKATMMQETALEEEQRVSKRLKIKETQNNDLSEDGKASV